MSGNSARSMIGMAFLEACRMPNNRLSIFTGLPIGSLDAPALRRHPDEIGRVDKEPTS